MRRPAHVWIIDALCVILGLAGFVVGFVLMGLYFAGKVN